MKTKTIVITLISAVIVVAGVFAFLYFRKKTELQNVNDIYGFMLSFNNDLGKGNVNAALKYFSGNKKKQAAFTDLIVRMMGKRKEKNGLPSPGVSLDIGSADIKVLTSTISVVTVPGSLVYQNFGSHPTSITFRLIKWGDRFKIINADVSHLIPDYVDYQNFIVDQVVPDSDRFSPLTLAAFKAATLLRSAYDSVIWFGHVGERTYFYVVKGKWKWSQYEGFERDSSQYKMGLVGPDLNEIIPAEYSLIHNIGGTFDNLIEVEKGSKRGFFDLTGKKVVPVIYDAIYPVTDNEYIAAMQNGDEFFWLKNDYTISDRVELKIADILAKLKKDGPFEMANSDYKGKDITEINSRDESASIYVAPSYLVDLGLIDRIRAFDNPLHKIVRYHRQNQKYELVDDADEPDQKYIVSSAERTGDGGNNWLQAAFYQIKDYFLGGRAEFYEKRNVLLVDTRRNKLYATDISIDNTDDEDGSPWRGAPCQVSMVKAINDSLIEIKSGTRLSKGLYDSTSTIAGGTYYTYAMIRKGKLKVLPNNRVFGFTKYVKMDDTYLDNCYNITEGMDFDKMKFYTVNKTTPEMLRYMKNEIYADYAYKFKDKRWADIFAGNTAYNHKANANVDDSLTVIDKYNIAFINQKLNTLKSDKAKVSLPK